MHFSSNSCSLCKWWWCSQWCHNYSSKVRWTNI